MHAKVLLTALMMLGCSSSAPPPATPANRSATEATEGVQYVGNPSAAVALTYYFDYLCPHCYTSAPVLDDIAQTYGNRIVVHYKNFQMAKHPDARLAAITAEAARRQGKYIEMHRLLMQHAAANAQTPEQMMATLQGGGEAAPTFSAPVLRELAGKLGLDLVRYDRDIADPAAAARVDGEYADGEKQGVEFVPVIYFGATRFEGRFEELPAAIDAKLR